MAKLTFQQFVEKMQQLIQEREDVTQRIKTFENPLKDRQRLSELNHIIRTGFELVFKNAMGSVPKEKTYEVFCNILPQSEKNAFDNGVVKIFNSAFFRGDKKLVDLVEDEELRNYLNSTNVLELVSQEKETNASLVQKCFAALSKLPEDVKEDAKNFFFSKMTPIATNLLSHMKNPDQEFLSAIQKLGQAAEINMDATVPEEEEYRAPSEHINDFVNPLKHGVISLMKKEDMSEEDKAMLDDIDQNILVSSSQKLTDFYFPIAEESASGLGHQQRESVMAELEKDPLFKACTKPDGVTSFISDFTKVQPEIYEDKVSEIAKAEVSFPEDYKKCVLEIAEGLDQIHDFSFNEPGEQGTKIYGLKGIADKKTALSQAIDSGDMAKIKAAYTDYKNAEAVMDKMLDAAHRMNPDKDFIGGNISVARTGGFAPKYVTDIVRVSRVNGIYHLWALSKRTGIPVKEFLDNPTKAFPKAVANYMDGGNTFNKFVKSHSIADIIRENGNGIKFMEETAHPDIAFADNLNRALESLVVACPNNQKLAVWEAEFKQTVGKGAMDISRGYESSLFTSHKNELLTNLFYTEPKDINILNFSKSGKKFHDPFTNKELGGFDGGAYLSDGNTSIYRVVARMADTIRDYENVPEKQSDNASKALRSSVKAAANAILDNPWIEKDQYTTRVLQAFASAADKDQPFNVNKMKVYHSYANMHAPDKLMSDIQYENYSKDSLSNTFKVMYTMKKRYDDSWFFQKWWGTETKALKAGAERLRTGLLDRGITENDIKEGENAVLEIAKTNNAAHLEAVCERIQNQERGIDDIIVMVNGNDSFEEELQNGNKDVNKVNIEINEEEKEVIDDLDDIGNVDRDEIFKNDNSKEL